MLRPAPQPEQTFQHQNGHDYKILVIARDDYTGQDLVIHQGIHDSRIWSRPMENFMGLKEGLPRFVRKDGRGPQAYQPIRSTMSG